MYDRVVYIDWIVGSIVTIGRAHKWSILNGLNNELCIFAHIHAGQRSRFAVYDAIKVLWSQQRKKYLQSINIRSRSFYFKAERPKTKGGTKAAMCNPESYP